MNEELVVPFLSLYGPCRPDPACPLVRRPDNLLVVEDGVSGIERAEDAFQGIVGIVRVYIEGVRVGELDEREERAARR